MLVGISTGQVYVCIAVFLLGCIRIQTGHTYFDARVRNPTYIINSLGYSIL